MEDYQEQVRTFPDGRQEAIEGLPKSNVLKYWLEGGCSFVVRPSGTEPKLKIYMSVSGDDRSGAHKLEEMLTEELEKRLK